MTVQYQLIRKETRTEVTVICKIGKLSVKSSDSAFNEAKQKAAIAMIEKIESILTSNQNIIEIIGPEPRKKEWRKDAEDERKNCKQDTNNRKECYQDYKEQCMHKEECSINTVAECKVLTKNVIDEVLCEKVKYTEVCREVITQESSQVPKEECMVLKNINERKCEPVDKDVQMTQSQCDEVSNHQVTDRQCPTRPLSQNEHSLSGPGSVSHWSGSPTDTRHPVLRKRTIHEDEEGDFVLEKTLCAASHEFFDYGRYILCKETFIIQLKYTEGLVSGFNRNRQSLMLNHFKLNGTPSQKMLLEPLSWHQLLKSKQ